MKTNTYTAGVVLENNYNKFNKKYSYNYKRSSADDDLSSKHHRGSTFQYQQKLGKHSQVAISIPINIPDEKGQDGVSSNGGLSHRDMTAIRYKKKSTLLSTTSNDSTNIKYDSDSSCTEPSIANNTTITDEEDDDDEDYRYVSRSKHMKW